MNSQRRDRGQSAATMKQARAGGPSSGLSEERNINPAHLDSSQEHQKWQWDLPMQNWWRLLLASFTPASSLVTSTDDNILDRSTSCVRACVCVIEKTEKRERGMEEELSF